MNLLFMVILGVVGWILNIFITACVSSLFTSDNVQLRYVRPAEREFYNGEYLRNLNAKHFSSMMICLLANAACFFFPENIIVCWVALIISAALLTLPILFAIGTLFLHIDASPKLVCANKISGIVRCAFPLALSLNILITYIL